MVVEELRAQQNAILLELKQVKKEDRDQVAEKIREELRRAKIIGGDGKLVSPYR